MPKKRVRKSSRGECDISCYKNAYNKVKTGISLRKAAENHRVNYASLLQYIRKRDVTGRVDDFNDTCFDMQKSSTCFLFNI
jgi:hypothetical protein